MGKGDTLHWEKGPHKWAWGHVALAKRPSYMGMGTLCNGKKAPINGHGDTLHWQKVPINGHGDTLHWQKGTHTWALGHFALSKTCPYMGMGTLCTVRKAPTYGWPWV